jgi:hypothetical protein
MIKLQQVTAPSALASSETSTVKTLYPASSSFARVLGNAVGKMISSPMGRQFAANGSQDPLRSDENRQSDRVHPVFVDEQGVIVHASDGRFQMQAVMHNYTGR